MKEIGIVIECIKPVDHCNSIIMLNLSRNVSNAPGDWAHLGIMLSLGVYRCQRGTEMPLVRTDAKARSHHGHLLTRTTSSSPAPSAFLGLIAGAHVVRCCLVHRLMKSTHVHRASCACVACCRGVRHSVCLSVCLSQVGTRAYLTHVGLWSHSE